MRNLITIVVVLLGITVFGQPTNIDIGIYNDASNGRIDVRILPNADFNGLYSNVVFTLKWPEDFALTLGDPDRNAVGNFAFVMSINKSGGIINSGGFNYQKFTGETTNLLSTGPVSFTNNQEFLICAIPYGLPSARSEVLTRMAQEIEISNDATVVTNGGTHYQEAGDGNDVTGIIYQPSISFSTLPITLSIFTAQKAGDRSVQLDWTSIKEVNASHFVVQRSDNGITFFDLGKVLATGNTNLPMDYQYLDREIQIQRNSAQILYYRLKQVDLDGYTDFSEIKAVRLDRLGNADISIYPNPTSDLLHLDISEEVNDSQLQYEIIEVNGKLVRTSLLDASFQKLHLLKLQEMGLQSGIYFIRLRNNKELLSSHKFVLISR